MGLIHLFEAFSSNPAVSYTHWHVVKNSLPSSSSPTNRIFKPPFKIATKSDQHTLHSAYSLAFVNPDLLASLHRPARGVSTSIWAVKGNKSASELYSPYARPESNVSVLASWNPSQRVSLAPVHTPSQLLALALSLTLMLRPLSGDLARISCSHLACSGSWGGF